MYQTVLKILAGLILLYIGGIDSLAEGRKYHDEALYGLKGDVSEVKTKTKSQLTVPSSAKFNTDGRETISIYAYDEAGYPIGYNFSIGKSEISREMEWTESNALKSLTFSSTLWPDKGSGKVDPFYGEDQFLPIKAVSVSENVKKTKKKTVVCEYSNYKLDDHGNWISRETKETVTENKKGKEKQTIAQFEETRTITY